VAKFISGAKHKGWNEDWDYYGCDKRRYLRELYQKSAWNFVHSKYRERVTDFFPSVGLKESFHRITLFPAEFGLNSKEKCTITY
jgi:hypothetical protein